MEDVAETFNCIFIIQKFYPFEKCKILSGTRWTHWVSIVRTLHNDIDGLSNNGWKN